MTFLTRRIRPTTKLAFDFANIRVNHRTASRSADDQRPVNANSAASGAGAKRGQPYSPHCTEGRLPSSRSKRLKPAENKFTQIDFTSFSMQVTANSHTFLFRKLQFILEETMSIKGSFSFGSVLPNDGNSIFVILRRVKLWKNNCMHFIFKKIISKFHDLFFLAGFFHWAQLEPEIAPALFWLGAWSGH